MGLNMFLRKSAELLENKRVGFWWVQKSAQLYKAKGLESLGTCRVSDSRKEGMHPPPHPADFS